MENSILTKRQQQIFEFILSSIDKFGYPPSIPEIQEKFFFKSPNAVKDHLEALERKGYISRRPRKSRGIEVLNHPPVQSYNKNVDDNVTEIPMIGRVSAGCPIIAYENIEGRIFVDKSIVKNNRGVFILKVKGASMVNANILDGDYILIRQQPTAEQGEMVVVLIEDEATVKRFYKEKNNVIRLKPENDAMDPIIVDPRESSVRIIGKVEGIIRKI